MAKRFKLRICRVIATTLQSCRSKDPSNLPQDPVPSFSNTPAATAAAFNHHVSSAFISINCALPSTHPPQFKWQREDKWHVVAKIPHPRHKIYNSDADDLTSAPPSSSEKKIRRRRKKKKNIPGRLRLSTSSADSGWFSSDAAAATAAEIDEEETETLVSSSPNSCSELHTIGEMQPLPQRRSKRRTKRGSSRAAAEGEIPARLSMFKKLIPCTVEGKVKESFAIVKKSEDPYEDFKSSMMDMIFEKQMFEEKELEQLLQCFLSLNSRHYHGIIVEAFSEIWETIFSPAAAPGVGRHRRQVSSVASY
ncbi:hypothetical protein ACS0TY_008512 [Phlomoides rotata]